jgi:hypothetical protein
MKTSIKYDNNEELGQILTILFAMGYKFHGEENHTPDGVIDTYKHRNFFYINIDEENEINLSRYNNYNYQEWNWANDFNEILKTVPNLKSKARIIVEDVGEYKATITKGNARIFGHNVTQEQVEEIYQSIQTLKNKGDSFCVSTQNDIDHRTLMSVLYSFGFTYHDEATYQDAHEKYKRYDSTKVDLDKKTISGFRYNIGVVFNFSKDLNEIVEKLRGEGSSKTISLGKYDAVVHSDHVIVGCQQIEESKVEEIRNALIKLQ